MQELGLDVANIAGRDLILGLDVFEEIQSELRLDFVSANIRVGGEPLAAPFRVYERSLDGRPVRIGVTGVTVRSRTAMLEWDSERRLEFADPVASARAILEELKAVSDVQILLAEMSQSALEDLVEADPDGYDVVVSSLGKLLETTPLGPGPVVLSPGSRGKRLAWLNLRTAAQGIEITGGEVLGLDEKIQDDPGMAARVETFVERLRKNAPEGRVSTTGAAEGAEAPPAETRRSP